MHACGGGDDDDAIISVLGIGGITCNPSQITRQEVRPAVIQPDTFNVFTLDSLFSLEFSRINFSLEERL